MHELEKKKKNSGQSFKQVCAAFFFLFSLFCPFVSVQNILSPERVWSPLDVPMHMKDSKERYFIVTKHNICQFPE